MLYRDLTAALCLADTRVEIHICVSVSCRYTNADWALATECCLQPSPACDSQVTSAQTESGLCYGGGFGKQGSFTVKRNCPSPEQFPGEPAPDSPVTASYYIPLNVVSSFFLF